VSTSTAAEPRFHPALPSALLVPGEPVGVVVDGDPICVVRLPDAVVAFEDRCPHRGTPLSQGMLEGTKLTCAAHTWEFDVRTGELLRLRAPVCLAMRAVRERDGLIEVGGPSPGPG
jgi:toluene monooxygenase system ferredoxin subunit